MIRIGEWGPSPEKCWLCGTRLASFEIPQGTSRSGLTATAAVTWACIKCDRRFTAYRAWEPFSSSARIEVDGEVFHLALWGASPKGLRELDECVLGALSDQILYQARRSEGVIPPDRYVADRPFPIYDDPHGDGDESCPDDDEADYDDWGDDDEEDSSDAALPRDCPKCSALIKWTGFSRTVPPGAILLGEDKA